MYMHVEWCYSLRVCTLYSSCECTVRFSVLAQGAFSALICASMCESVLEAQLSREAQLFGM